MIGLSENAADKVRELIEKRPNETQGLRVGVRGGGCSGFTYFLEFAEGPTKETELESHGVQLFVDPKSYLYLMGRRSTTSIILANRGLSSQIRMHAALAVAARASASNPFSTTNTPGLTMFLARRSP